MRAAAHLDGILRKHGAVQLHWGQAEVLRDVAVFDGELREGGGARRASAASAQSAAVTAGMFLRLGAEGADVRTNRSVPHEILEGKTGQREGVKVPFNMHRLALPPHTNFHNNSDILYPLYIFILGHYSGL